MALPMPTPTILEVDEVADFLQYVLERHTDPSTIIVCASKATFLNSLTPKASWTQPTLRLLQTSRTLSIVFCPDFTHLRAYLSSYSVTANARRGLVETSAPNAAGYPILAIVNPIQAHTRSSAFSAQGLNRTFAAAIDAAHYANSALLMTECPILPVPGEATQDGAEGMLGDSDLPTERDPWSEPVSILNVTTKSFGVGKHGWAGRIVDIRTIAQRWFTFQRLPAASDASVRDALLQA